MAGRVPRGVPAVPERSARPRARYLAVRPRGASLRRLKRPSPAGCSSGGAAELAGKDVARLADLGHRRQTPVTGCPTEEAKRPAASWRSH